MGLIIFLCSQVSMRLVPVISKQLLEEFNDILAIKKSYDKFDNLISEIRSEAKKGYDSYKKAIKEKGNVEDPEINDQYNAFISEAKKIRREFNEITDRTESFKKESELFSRFINKYKAFDKSIRMFKKMFWSEPNTYRSFHFW